MCFMTIVTMVLSDFEAESERKSVSVFTLATKSMQGTFFAWLMKRSELNSSWLHSRSILSKLVTGKVNSSSTQLPAYTRPHKNSVGSEIRPKKPQLASTYKCCGMYTHIHSISREYLRVFSVVCTIIRKQIMRT
jgi:hypothetical protein